MCQAHATVRGLLGEIIAQTGDGHDIIVDMEAGLEHLSRGTGKHVSSFVAVLEPYYRSLETARRIGELAAELGVKNVVAVANKVRDDEDRRAIADYCSAHALKLLGEIAYDSALVEAERIHQAPIDYDAASPAVIAMRELAGALLNEGA